MTEVLRRPGAELIAEVTEDGSVKLHYKFCKWAIDQRIFFSEPYNIAWAMADSINSMVKLAGEANVRH